MSCAAVDVVVHAQRVKITHGVWMKKGALLHSLEGNTEAPVKYVAESRVLVCTFDMKLMHGATYSVFRKLSRSASMPPSQNIEESILRKSLALKVTHERIGAERRE